MRKGLLKSHKRDRHWQIQRADMIDFLEHRVFSIGWPVGPLRTSPVFGAFMAAVSRNASTLSHRL